MYIRRLAVFAMVALALPACGGGGGGGGGGPSAGATLASIAVSAGTLTPVFAPATTSYAATVGSAVSSVSITPTASDPGGATIRVNGGIVNSGVASAPQPLAPSPTPNPIDVAVTAPDGVTVLHYTIVFTRNAALGQEAYVKASNPAANVRFGIAVALSGDTLVVGASDEDTGGADSGAAYVFVRNGTAWSQQAFLKASNAGAGDFFGSSVAIDGDTIVVGALLEDSAATGVGGNQADDSVSGSGAAYVFVRSGTVWSQQAYLKASNTRVAFSGQLFGQSVAVSGDTIAVGASGEESNATGIGGNQSDASLNSAGAVYVFVRTVGPVWSQQAYVKASDTAIVHQFGHRTALQGDTLVVTRLGGGGSCYVFVRAATSWSQQARFQGSNTETNDQFGTSVALSGDTIAVGAPNERSIATGIGGNELDNSAQNAGAAYVFVRNGLIWTQQAYVKATNTAAFDQFAYSLGLSGDMLVVGAPNEAGGSAGIGGNQADNSLGNAGAAYVFRRNGAAWTSQDYVKASNPDSVDLFGASVAAAGDTFVVGAINEASAATGVGGDQSDNSRGLAGASYVFR